MSNETEQQANTEEVQETTEVQEGQSSLTVQDLMGLRTIINIASQRGAFKPEEFQAVGASYTKLSGFIEAVAPSVQEGAAPEAGPKE